MLDSDRLTNNWGCALTGVGCLGMVTFGIIGLAGSAAGFGLAGMMGALGGAFLTVLGLSMMGMRVPRWVVLALAGVDVLIIVLGIHSINTPQAPAERVEVTTAGDTVTVTVSKFLKGDIIWIWIDGQLQDPGILHDASGAGVKSYKVAPGKHELMACYTEYTNYPSDCPATISFSTP